MTNMTVNFNKCRAMKKIITSILIAAAAFTACVQNNDEVIVKSDKVTFSATLDAPVSRTVLVEQDGKFHAEWCEGDKIYIFQVTDCSSRTSESTNLTTGGKTASVDVEFNAATATNSFHYIAASPVASMAKSAAYMAFDGISGVQAPAAMNTFDGKSDFILSKAVERTTQPAGETINFENTRISAIAKVSVKNLALAADDEVVSVTFVCQQPIAGKVSRVMLENIIVGDPMKTHNHETTINSITVTLPEAQTADFSYYMCVWPETLKADEAYSVKVVTTAGKEYVKEGTIAKDLVFTSGNITAFTVNMAGIGEDIVTYIPYVEVAGIKWATGNLEYEVGGTTSEGFATGWCIAPSQEHHFYIGASGNKTDIGSEYLKISHFNFGGIENPFNDSATSALQVAAGDPEINFNGKMYTDSACANQTTDFAAAKYGDVAFWASNGQYRMPTAAEFELLYTNACRTKATYNGVAGTYYYNPSETETAGEVEGTKALTENDLEVGLFLPWPGRGYNKSGTTLASINQQGVYRTATVGSTSTVDNTFGIVYRAHTLTEAAGKYEAVYNYSYYESKNQDAYGAKARYCIRPIYIAQ